MEDTFYELAKEEDKPCVIICDRGVMDGRGFSDPKVWNALMEESGLNTVQMLNRYDAVLHLVTAAEGAEEFFDYNNEARYTSPEESRVADKALLKAWNGHSQHFIIDNMRPGGFDAKMKWSIDCIL
jgi:hypothetical protein